MGRKSKATRLIEKMAENDGVSVDVTRRELERAIARAYKKCSDDEIMRNYWKKWRTRRPTPDEFLSTVSIDVLKKLLTCK